MARDHKSSTFILRVPKGPTVDQSHNSALARSLEDILLESWKGTERFEEDPSRSSFLFSLTNQFKHSLIENPPGDKRGSPGWKYAIRPSVHYGRIMGWSYDFKWSHYEGTIHNRVKLGWSYECRIGGKNMQNCQNDFAGSAEKWGVTEWEMYYHS